LIGLSAGGILLHHGRIAGISGIFNGIRSASGSDLAFRLAFVFGISIGGFIAANVLNVGTLATIDDTNLVQYGVSGLIVGVGVTLGHGCTSVRQYYICCHNYLYCVLTWFIIVDDLW
jgi:uncharacterized membrane protein YedE/YeeE